MSRPSLPGSSRLSKAEFAVLVSGITSMGLEILAGRAIAPEFGNTIYTWGSIIGVFLAALSLGYWIGGNRARERASNANIVVILVQSALFVAFLLAARDVVLQTAEALPVPARFAPIIPITILWGPPTFLLGFISPYAAELSPADGTGNASGRVYALGTVGSIAGAFGTTFFLIPNFSVPVIELGFGLSLLLGAVVVAERATPTNVGRGLVVLLALTAGFAVNGYGLTTPGDTVYATSTEYQDLEVTDHQGVRTLYLDGAPQSAMYVDGRDGYVFDYSAYLHVPMLMQDDVDRVLFIGGGGFSSPKRYLREYPNVTVDVVELDPEVVRTAYQYFDVPDSPRLNVHVKDGRQFLEQTNHTYDVIVLDAFRKDQVPLHLTTVEFMELAESRLDDDGALVANVISASSGSGSEFYRSQYKTLRRAFPHVYAFPTSNTAFLQNIELVASVRPTGFTEAELVERARTRDVGVDLVDEVRRYRDAGDVPTGDVPVLTDDHAPVDSLLDPQYGRRYVISQNATATTTTATG